MSEDALLCPNKPLLWPKENRENGKLDHVECMQMSYSLGVYDECKCNIK